MLKFGVRWNTTNCAACSASRGMTWMPDEPVPMTPTRWPLKSTPSCGQLPVWKVRPAKLSMPGISGIRVADRQPVAMTQKRAEISSPRWVCTCQRAEVSS